MEIKENDLIKRLKKFEQKNSLVIRGIGDDGAVVGMDQGSYVFVQDALVEHIHFEFSFTSAFSVGKKSIYVNVSDILSMGAEPLYFLVTIGIPDTMSYKDIENLYKGMHRAAGEFNVTLLGGDTVQTKSDFFIDISMIGVLKSNKYMGRDTANAGDLIGVTGWLGESAFGLHLLKNGHDPKRINRFVKRYGEPKPPYNIWKELMKRGITNAMMDISDGLIIDLERMMSESKEDRRGKRQCGLRNADCETRNGERGRAEGERQKKMFPSTHQLHIFDPFYWPLKCSDIHSRDTFP